MGVYVFANVGQYSKPVLKIKVNGKYKYTIYQNEFIGIKGVDIGDVITVIDCGMLGLKNNILWEFTLNRQSIENELEVRNQGVKIV